MNWAVKDKLLVPGLADCDHNWFSTIPTADLFETAELGDWLQKVPSGIAGIPASKYPHVICARPRQAEFEKRSMGEWDCSPRYTSL